MKFNKLTILTSVTAGVLMTSAVALTSVQLVKADTTVTVNNTQSSADATNADVNSNTSTSESSDPSEDASIKAANHSQYTKDLKQSQQDTIAALGSSLTSQQKADTLATLLKGAGQPEQYQQIAVNGDALVKYLDPNQQTFNATSPVYSSALVKKNDESTGIDVQILPFNGAKTITSITEDQYKNAALTAGVTDATIYVTSPTKIDGSGALAGVYASLASQGTQLDNTRVAAAQDEMKTLNNITQSNENKDGYSDAQLNNAVAGTKADMAKADDTLDRDKVTVIVNNNLNKNNLDNVLTGGQKDQIVSTMMKIQDSGALKDKDFKGQANKVASNIKDGAKNIFNKLNTQENRNFLQRLWTSIVNFFKGLF